MLSYETFRDSIGKNVLTIYIETIVWPKNSVILNLKRKNIHTILINDKEKRELANNDENLARNM